MIVSLPYTTRVKQGFFLRTLVSLKIWISNEKYDCSGSLQNISTIVINKARTGNYAKIVSPAGETKANILQINEQTAWLSHKNMQMTINRKTGAVTMVQGTKYIKLGYKKPVFKM